MNSFFTIPNIVSLFRIYLTIPIIFFIWLEGKYYILSIVLLVIAYISDAVDGILARWLNQVSEWGKIIDPLGDKILSTALVVTFYQMGEVSLWFLLIVVGRDLLISIFSTKMVKNFRFVYHSALIGKIVTFMLFVFYLFILLRFIGFVNVNFIKNLEIIVILFVVVSGMYYLTLYIRKFSEYKETNE